jgi:hypothetical protein
MLGVPILEPMAAHASASDLSEMRTRQIRREDWKLNETPQMNTQTFRKMLVLLLVPVRDRFDVKSGGAIALDLNGNKVNGLIRLESTYNALDPISWRQ